MNYGQKEASKGLKRLFEKGCLPHVCATHLMESFKCPKLSELSEQRSKPLIASWRVAGLNGRGFLFIFPCHVSASRWPLPASGNHRQCRLYAICKSYSYKWITPSTSAVHASATVTATFVAVATTTVAVTIVFVFGIFRASSRVSSSRV